MQIAILLFKAGQSSAYLSYNTRFIFLGWILLYLNLSIMEINLFWEVKQLNQSSLAMMVFTLPPLRKEMLIKPINMFRRILWPVFLQSYTKPCFLLRFKLAVSATFLPTSSVLLQSSLKSFLRSIFPQYWVLCSPTRP